MSDDIVGGMAINPTGAGMKAFLEDGPDEPVAMLNLLRFTEGGGEKYDEYLAHFREYAESLGARILYYGHGRDPLVAEQGQDWDAVLLVWYPTRRAFSEMVRHPDYQRSTHLRTESLVEAVLQPTVPREMAAAVPGAVALRVTDGRAAW